MPCLGLRCSDVSRPLENCPTSWSRLFRTWMPSSCQTRLEFECSLTGSLHFLFHYPKITPIFYLLKGDYLYSCSRAASGIVSEDLYSPGNIIIRFPYTPYSIYLRGTMTSSKNRWLRVREVKRWFHTARVQSGQPEHPEVLI